MIRLLITTILLTSGTNSIFAQRGGIAPQNQNPLRRGDGPARPASIQEEVERFYLNQLRNQVELNEAQFAEIGPMLRLALRERRDIEARRTQAANQTRQAIRRGASDEELRSLMSEMDRADADRLASQQRFLRSVDPILSVQQLARLRVFESVIEQRIRALIDRARVSRGQRQ